MKETLRQIVVSGFSGFFGKLLVIFTCLALGGYMNHKWGGAGNSDFWQFMRSSMFVFSGIIASATGFLLSSGFFHKLLDHSLKKRELKVKELELKLKIKKAETDSEPES